MRWISTTSSDPWVEQATPEYIALEGMPSAFVNSSNRKQTIEGFGASFNEFGWTAMAHLSQEDRNDIMQNLFAPGLGLNLSLCRMSIGANDFSRDWYSYDEVEGDFDLENFSIANDKETVIPFINAAKAHQPNLKLWASPWSPPTWMKRNGHYAGALPNPAFNKIENGLREDQVQTEGTDNFKMEEAYLSAYAKYFAKFIDSYSEQGIEIGMVMPQNEFNSAQVFPSCVWTPAGLTKFITHLGPEMEKRGVEIFLGTLERANERMALDVIQDPVAGKYLSGVGVQWAGKGAIAFIHRALPELRIYQSEQECGDGKNDWRFARYAWSLMKHNFENGATGYMYWNMALEEGGVSRWGWAQNSLVVVDSKTKKYRFSHEYQLLKHVSHFVEVGAQVLPTFSWSGFEQQIAFRNPNGSIVLVVHNGESEAVEYMPLIDGKAMKVTLQANSFNTFFID
jgi:glucosylceramidase